MSRAILDRRALIAAAALAAVAVAPARIEGQAAGDPVRGEATFAAKHCARCHRAGDAQGVGPPLGDLRRPQGAYELTGRLWNHAPAMFTVLVQEGLTWPDIDAAQMADLMAYLGGDVRRDPAPNVLKGQMTLVTKGCLKCHSFRGEGARVAPDLAGRPEDYAPPAAWAAKMWRHTPRMAAKALERGVLYPRFTGDEMVDMLAFLRGAGAAR
jgi:cytochrome c2